MRPSFRRPPIVVAALPLAACLSQVVPAGASRADDPGIMAAVDSVIVAISTADTALMRRHLAPGAVFEAREVPRGRVFSYTDVDVYKGLASETTPQLERIWAPRVTREGATVVVTAPYDFWTAGRFSHCGTDVFRVVAVDGRWRVQRIDYTIQREGCRPSPLGTPPGMRAQPTSDA